MMINAGESILHEEKVEENEVEVLQIFVELKKFLSTPTKSNNCSNNWYTQIN